MKIKLTLLVAQINNKISVQNDNHFKIYLTPDNKFPSKLLTTKDEKETLAEIHQKFFNLDPSWSKKDLADFRVILDDNNEKIAEVVYISYIPEILGILKSGKFLSETEIKQEKIQIEEFYEKIYAQKGKFFF